MSKLLDRLKVERKFLKKRVEYKKKITERKLWNLKRLFFEGEIAYIKVRR